MFSKIYLKVSSFSTLSYCINVENSCNILDSLTSSLVPLRPFPLPPTCEPTIEITEFEGTNEKDIHPYSTFINHLYVYPLCLNFDTQKMFARARNIACTVEVRDSDAEGAKGLQVLFNFISKTVCKRNTVKY